MAAPISRRIKNQALLRARRLADRYGYKLIKVGDPPPPEDFTDAEHALYRRVKPYTLTGPERVIALRDAVRYTCQVPIPGAFVECGVWRGGSMMVIALTLLEQAVIDRDLYLFDTFTEMPDPTDRDMDIWGRKMADHIEAARATRALQNTPVEQVRDLIVATGYPPERIHMVKGMVEETVPDQAPDEIALLRLDTDFYESTSHEMAHLYPRVPPGGVVIIDDYGEFVGCREAVDEHLAGQPVLLNRIDYTGRLVLVPPPDGWLQAPENP